MNDLQDIIFTTIADDINVTINSLNLYVTQLIPSTSTQVFLMNLLWIIIQSLSIHGIPNVKFQTMVENFRLISVVHKILIVRNIWYQIFKQMQEQLLTKLVTQRYLIIITSKYFVEIDGIRYPKDGILTNFEENSYLDQYRDLKSFYKDYFGEKLMQLFITFPDMIFFTLFK